MAGKITSLTTQKKNKTRVNVYIDGEFALGLAGIEAARLRVGQWLEDAEIESLLAADERERSHQQALHFLSFRPRSAQEVRRNLAKKDFSPATIEASLERLERAGLVDDLAFARYWVEQREQFRPRSSKMLRYELIQKGIKQDIISAVLETVDDEKLAYQAGTAWARRNSALEQQDFKRKLSDYMLRRGFPYAIVQSSVQRLLQESLNRDE